MNNVVNMEPGKTEVIKKRKKALSVSPLKTSQTIGGALAVLGVARAVPLMHGSQGCTAFAQVFFVRHFREPVPLQTTAMDQVSSVMGADGNIVEALKVICEKSAPALIGLVTTGLAETQGADIKRAVGEFRRQYPQFVSTAVMAVNTPDFSGSFESGKRLAANPGACGRSRQPPCRSASQTGKCTLWCQSVSDRPGVCCRKYRELWLAAAADT